MNFIKCWSQTGMNNNIRHNCKTLLHSCNGRVAIYRSFFFFGRSWNTCPRLIFHQPDSTIIKYSQLLIVLLHYYSYDRSYRRCGEYLKLLRHILVKPARRHGWCQRAYRLSISIYVMSDFRAFSQSSRGRQCRQYPVCRDARRTWIKG